MLSVVSNLGTFQSFNEMSRPIGQQFRNISFFSNVHAHWIVDPCSIHLNGKFQIWWLNGKQFHKVSYFPVFAKFHDFPTSNFSKWLPCTKCLNSLHMQMIPAFIRENFFYSGNPKTAQYFFPGILIEIMTSDKNFRGLETNGVPTPQPK